MAPLVSRSHVVEVFTRIEGKDQSVLDKWIPNLRDRNQIGIESAILSAILKARCADITGARLRDGSVFARYFKLLDTYTPKEQTRPDPVDCNHQPSRRDILLSVQGPIKFRSCPALFMYQEALDARQDVLGRDV